MYVFYRMLGLRCYIPIGSNTIRKSAPGLILSVLLFSHHTVILVLHYVNIAKAIERGEGWQDLVLYYQTGR